MPRSVPFGMSPGWTATTVAHLPHCTFMCPPLPGFTVHPRRFTIRKSSRAVTMKL